MLITTMKTANSMFDRGEVKGKVEEGREETGIRYVRKWLQSQNIGRK